MVLVASNHNHIGRHNSLKGKMVEPPPAGETEQPAWEMG